MSGTKEQRRIKHTRQDSISPLTISEKTDSDMLIDDKGEKSFNNVRV